MIPAMVCFFLVNLFAMLDVNFDFFFKNRKNTNQQTGRMCTEVVVCAGVRQSLST